MPTSTFSHIPTLVQYLQMVRPRSILDVGLGNGKLGFIARDLLDVMLGERYLKQDWQVKIDGIEVFERYIQAHQRFLYDRIYIGDAFEVIDTLADYDLVMLGDVLEHFEKERAVAFLNKCFRHTREYIILCVPLGEGWLQPVIYGNRHEEHRSWWHVEDFDAMATMKELFHFPRIGDYGCFLLNRSDHIHAPIREACDQLAAKGDLTGAVGVLAEALARGPSNL